MRTLPMLFSNNRALAARVQASDPGLFQRLTEQQAPRYLWIGCSDSRVPANEIVGLAPGELFVHRNVANLVVHTDLNCLAVLQYAVEILKVEHVIVCGHYGCGGVRAAMESRQLGLIDNWLRNIKDVYQRHSMKLDAITDKEERINHLCELNVQSQVMNVVHTGVVQNAWKNGQQLSVHGWIYNISDGLLRDLGLCVTSSDDIEKIYRIEPDGR